MSLLTTEPRPEEIRVGETALITVVFDPHIQSAITISSPAVAEQTTAHLTISSATVNNAAVVCKGVSYAIGKVVSFYVSGHHAATDYEVITTVSTSDGQTRKIAIVLKSRP